MTTTIEKSIEIDAPLRAAYDFWANFADYPRFMPHLQAVEQVDDTHWRWRGELGGKNLEWDAEVTENVPGESIGWQTRSKGNRSSTTVRFAPLADGRTAVTFTAHYPNGVGKGLSAAELAHQAEEHLARFTELLLGRAPADEAPADADPVAADAGDDAEPGMSADHTQDSGQDSAQVDDTDTVEAVDEDLGRKPFHAATTWPFGQAARRGARSPWSTSAAQADADAGSDPQDDDQSTTDVLGPAYSVNKPQADPLGATWRVRADAADGSGWLRESGLARSLDALMASNPLLPLQAPRSVMQGSWFSSTFQMMTWPLSLMERLSQDLDRQVEAFLRGSPARDGAGADHQASPGGSGWSPEIDVDQTEDSLKVRADLPGVAYDDDVEVEVRDGQLVISGELRHPIYADGHEPASDGPSDGDEVVPGRFVRAIPLPAGVDAYGAQASLHDGVLEITLAGPAQRQRRIEISHGQRRH
jgi:HSP20 family molecular chaperone IbpA